MWNAVPTEFHQYHLDTGPDRPFYMPEFQGACLYCVCKGLSR